MITYSTLSKYLAKIFAQQFLIISTIIICILFITNAFDVLQNFKGTNITSDDFGKLIAFKIPYLFSEVGALIAFISTFAFLRNISRQNELIIILSSGVPIWRVFLAPIIITFFIGIFIVGIINPLGTYGLKNYKALDDKIHKTQNLNFVISQAGFLFFENFANDSRVIQAKSINAKTNSLTNVTVLLLDDDNNLTKRIDAPIAVLKPKMFELTSAIITTNTTSEKSDIINLPTNLSINNLLQRFTPPELISIWNLKNTIEEFTNSGLVVTQYQIHYYKNLFKPMAMMAMSFIACWFISLNIRDNSNVRIVTLGLVVGISAYFFLEITLRILASSGLHPMLATLLPIIFIILVSNFVILHFQEA